MKYTTAYYVYRHFYIHHLRGISMLFRAVHNKLEQSMRLSTIRDYPSFYQLLIQTRWAQIRQLNVIKRGRNCGRKQIPSHKDKTTSMAVAVTAVATVAESLMWRNEILVATHRSVAVNRRDNVRDLKPITPTRDGFHSPCKTLHYRPLLSQFVALRVVSAPSGAPDFEAAWVRSHSEKNGPFRPLQNFCVLSLTLSG